MLTMKRCFVSVVFGLVSLVFLCCTAQAYYAEYTINSVANGGLLYNDTYYLTLEGYDSTGTLVSYTVANTFTNAADAEYYANTTMGLTGWSYTSAGISTGTGMIGYSVTLAAGEYKISAVSGGFTYDSWDWSSNYGQYMWLLQIVLDGGWYGSIGSTTTASSISGLTLTNYCTYLTLTGTQTLTFYVWDNNTMDNLGDLTFSIASVPLPSSLLLALGGLPALALFRVRRFFSKK
jgi:hypothetical protein